MSRGSEAGYAVYLDDILEACHRIERYTENLDRIRFLRNTLVQDGVIRNLEVIGEAVKKLPAEVRTRYPDVEWRKVAGLRDVLIHEYASVDLEIVWDIVSTSLAPLKATVSQMRSDAP